jgi:hypothetical protein
MNGDVVALRLCLERAAPLRKSKGPLSPPIAGNSGNIEIHGGEGQKPKP